MKRIKRAFSVALALILLWAAASEAPLRPALAQEGEGLAPAAEVEFPPAGAAPAPDVIEVAEEPEAEPSEAPAGDEAPEIVVEIPTEEAPAGDEPIGDASPEELPPVEAEEILEEAVAAEPTAEAPELFAESEELLPLDAIPDGFVIRDTTLTDYTGSEPDITIPEGVTAIGPRAFADCTVLHSVTIPEYVTSIGYDAFQGCANLQEVTFNCAMEEFPRSCFMDCTSLQTVNLNGSVQSIGENAFYDCDSLTSIDFIDGATSIGDSAFAYCDGLREIRIPGSVTDVKYSVFYECTNLESVTLEAGSEPLCFESAYDCFGYCPIRSATIARNYQVKDGYSLFDRTYSDENHLTSVTITDDVTAIPDSAFSGCDKLNDVRIGKNVTSIGAHAFSGCDIEEIQLPGGITEIAEGLFSGCDKLSAVNIPEQVTSIGKSAFSGCAFTDIQLPDGLTEIPEEAFQHCDNLELIDIPSRVTRIGKSAFSGCDMLWRVNLPDGLEEIGDSAFSGCYKLDKINLPGGLSSIGDSAFRSCDTLKSLNLPDTLTHIGKYAFSDCGVTSFDVPSGITEIPEGAFASRNLTSIQLPAALTSIGPKAFQDSGLRSIEIPGSVSSIGSQAFSGSSLDSIEIPEGVTSIGSRAFSESDLRSVSFSRGMTTIETYLFAGCYELTSITVPGYITTVKNYAFQGCENLTNAVLEEGVTKLGDGAFMDCGKLRMVKLPESLTGFGRYPFENCGNLTAFVTAGSEAESYCKQNNIPYSTGSVGTIEFTGVKDGDAIPAGIDYTLNWKAVSGADAYHVEWRVGNKHEDEDGIYWYWEGPEPETVTSPSITFTDHYGGGWVYLISVTAYRQSDSGSVLLADGSITLRPDFNVSSITFPSSLRLGVGQSQTVAASSNRDSKFTYKSSDTKVATISAAGLVKAIKAGTATLTAKGNNSGETASCRLTVYPVPTKVSLAPAKLSIGVGQTSPLAVTLTPADAETELSYSSGNGAIAAVDEDGVVTGMGVGTATVTVKTSNGKSAKCTVTVKAAPESLRFDPAERTMTVGRGATLAPILTPANAAASIAFESSDTSVATVDADGRLEIVGVGDATITATAHNGISGAVTVHALAAPEKLGGVPEEVTLGVGESLALTPTAGENPDIAYSFTSKSAGVASVSAAGKISARKAGETVVTVAADTGASANCSVTVLAAPSSITLTASSATLGVGDELQLTATLPNNSASAISFSANDKGKYISVGADGRVKAVAPGTATVTAKTFNGKKASCKITVRVAPESVSLEPLKLAEGQSAALAPALSPAAAAASFVYESDGEGIATVDAEGVVTAVRAGEATISATAHNGARGECRVRVLPAPERIILDVTEATLGRGETLTLHPSVEEGSQTTFSFASSNTAVATVDASGKITASTKKSGTATITVTSHNGVTAPCKITVVSAPSKITLSATSATLGAGDALQLTATLPDGSASAIDFSSSKESVATVDASGKVTAVAPGTATITAKTFNGKKASCKVTVKNAPASIKLDREALKLAEGQSLQLQPMLSAGSAASLTYQSSASGVATVDEDGTVTAVTYGTAEVTVTAYNGESASCAVTVVPEPANLSIGEITLGKGESLELKPSVDSGADSDVYPFSYAVKKASIASVNASGKLSGKAAGTTTLTVKTYNGLTATCEVTVTAAPASVSFTVKGVTMSPGCTLRLDAVLNGETASKLRYESSDEAVATVAEDGTVTAVAPGAATITVKTFNNKQAKFALTVE